MLLLGPKFDLRCLLLHLHQLLLLLQLHLHLLFSLLQIRLLRLSIPLSLLVRLLLAVATRPS